MGDLYPLEDRCREFVIDIDLVLGAAIKNVSIGHRKSFVVKINCKILNALIVKVNDFKDTACFFKYFFFENCMCGL